MTVAHTVPVFFDITIVRAKIRDICQWIFIARVIPRQGRKVTCKRAKAKLVWAFAASISNLSNGQRWEAQRAAEQCLETGGMMFERSEFLPPQALRQAASGEVRTDWKMSQSDSWAKEAPNAVHDCPVFGTFLKKYRKQDYRMNIR